MRVSEKPAYTSAAACIIGLIAVYTSRVSKRHRLTLSRSVRLESPTYIRHTVAARALRPHNGKAVIFA